MFCIAICSNINAQVKTKIFNEGIAPKFIPVNKSIIPEKVIAASVEFLIIKSNQTQTRVPNRIFKQVCNTRRN